MVRDRGAVAGEGRVTTLTDFLLARIAEDEANASVGGPSSREWDHETDEGEYVATTGATVARVNLAGWGAHIARHDPARVLAECEAKRRIVESCQRLEEQSLDGAWWIVEQDAILLALALPYADHADYREEWKP